MDTQLDPRALSSVQGTSPPTNFPCVLHSNNTELIAGPRYVTLGYTTMPFARAVALIWGTLYSLFAKVNSYLSSETLFSHYLLCDAYSDFSPPSTV